MVDVTVITLVRTATHVLLGLRKTGIGQGRWNGIGGEVRTGEKTEDAAKRHLDEKCGLKVSSLTKLGIINFKHETNPREIRLELHIFSAYNFEGVIMETEDVKPQWFLVDQLPHGSMGKSDKYWYKYFLKGQFFRGDVIFRGNCNAEMSYQTETWSVERVSHL